MKPYHLISLGCLALLTALFVVLQKTEQAATKEPQGAVSPDQTSRNTQTRAPETTRPLPWRRSSRPEPVRQEIQEDARKKLEGATKNVVEFSLALADLNLIGESADDQPEQTGFGVHIEFPSGFDFQTVAEEMEKNMERGFKYRVLPQNFLTEWEQENPLAAAEWQSRITEIFLEGNNQWLLNMKQ